MPRNRMKTRLTARSIRDQLWNHADNTPANDTPGGGQAGSSGQPGGAGNGAAAGSSGGATGDEEDLGPKGMDALRKERAENDLLKAQLAALRNQSPEMQAAVAEAQRKVEEANERARRADEDRQRAVEDTRARLEGKHQKERDQLQSERDKAIAAANDLKLKTGFAAAFQKADGRSGGDSKITHMDAVLNALRSNLRLDPNSGKITVVDDDGDPWPSADKSGPIDLVDWLNLQADSSPVIGAHFNPKGGQGSGGLTGARGYRTQQGRDPKELAKMTPTQLLSGAYPD